MLNIPKYKEASRVFYYFEEISKIPRGSANTAPIANYLADFASKHSLKYERDDADNVIIRKPATAGYENKPTVIIQGHTDMVAEKLSTSKKDLAKDGIEIYEDGGFIKARETTLGADDGIAIAYALALLESKSLPHPAIEALFTSDEEIGLIGAQRLDKSRLNGKMLINIDSDEEGVFVAGCAGGIRTDITLPIVREACDWKHYKLCITGLAGGHSGTEIGKGRANAIKLGFRLLSSLAEIRLAYAESGNMDNAIPRSFTAHFCANGEPRPLFDKISAELSEEYEVTEPQMKIELTQENSDILPCDKATTYKILSICEKIPYGPQKTNDALGGIVEVSVNSGILRIDKDFKLCTSIRSSAESDKLALVEQLKRIAEATGANLSTDGSYPGWEYREVSALRDIFVSAYGKLFGKKAQVVTIHAGLECGIFADAIDGLDCISAGPDIFDIHTTEERLSISSAKNFFNLLCEVLKQI